MEFEWDKEKANANFKKHGVSFNEAAEAFNNPNAVEFFDENNSFLEIRFRLLGFNRNGFYLSDIQLEIVKQFG